MNRKTWLYIGMISGALFVAASCKSKGTVSTGGHPSTGMDGGTTDDGGPADGVTETDTNTVVTQPCINATGGQMVRSTRISPNHRKIEYYDGSSWRTFADGTSTVAIMMQCSYSTSGQAAVVCTQNARNPPALDVALECAVAADGASTFVNDATFDGNPNAWLRDICVGTSDGPLEILATYGTSPLWDQSATPTTAGTTGCKRMAWQSGSGWNTLSDGACACAQLDGQPCTDPCFIGTGSYSGGVCNTSGLTSACDDGDPTTFDHCTGDPANLCVHDPQM